MRILYFLPGLVGPLLAGTLLATSATAEGFADLYGGGAFTEDDRGFSMPGFSTGGDAEFESSGVVGGRIGGWIDDFHFIGGAFDVSWFGPDGEDGTDPAELDVIPISFLLMGRVPLLTSDEYPHGQLQPYLGVGPSLVVSKLEVPLPGSDFEDAEVDAGVDLRAGMAFVPVEPVGLFLEYRFTHFEPEYEDQGARAETELSTHFAQAGLSFRF